MRASLLPTLTLMVGLLAPAALAQTPSPAAPPATTKPPAAAPAVTPPAPKDSGKEAAKPAAADAKTALIDINSATPQELSQLKGIGEARSAAIVKGRPYRGKDDLLHKKIIPESVYAEIKDRIIAKQK